MELSILANEQGVNRRLGIELGIPHLNLTDEVERIAKELDLRGRVPPRSGADAFHIGYAAVHAMKYLLTQSEGCWLSAIGYRPENTEHHAQILAES